MNKQELIKITFAKVKNVGILVLLPIFFTLIFSLVFSKVFVEQIPFGVLDLDNSSTSRTIVRQFEDHPGFKVTYHAGSYDDINEKNKIRKNSSCYYYTKEFWQRCIGNEGSKDYTFGK
ncbi:ABC transporter permease [Clostridium carboxidivorans]|uniref:ABC transporter permease n=1 Tax=Clostridium carboxidivorans TaxID=217159 RepID=UPI001F612838|nr:ABC transporter permease [Clostridium carboxidivorans]